MFVDQLATASDVTRIVGEKDSLTIARILAIAPTRDELDQAVRSVEHEPPPREEPRTPSSARVASVRAVIDDRARTDATRTSEPVLAWRGS